MSDLTSDVALKDAIRARLADLGHDGAIIVGYCAVIEVVTPGEADPWLKTLRDPESMPWTALGRVEALRQVTEQDLRDGWMGDDE